jgi:hypothetical protein
MPLAQAILVAGLCRSSQTDAPQQRKGRKVAIGETSGEFNYSVTSSTFERQAGGGSQVVINVEGTATGFGQANGTLTMVAPALGAAAGPGSYTGASFSDAGEVIGVTGEGCWQQLDGENKWRVRGINLTSNGGVILSDGTLDLASRTFSGTIAEWT